MAQYQWTGSMEAHSDKLALFTLPVTDTGVEQVEYVEYRPVSQIGEGSCVEFNVSKNSIRYIDLKKTRLQTKFQILKEDNTKIGNIKTDPVSTINIPFHSLWRQVDVSLQQKDIGADVGNNYAYKAYLDTLLGRGVESKESQLTSILYYEDDAGNMDEADPEAETGANSGLFERAKYTQNSKVVVVEGSIAHDLFQSERYLLNGVELDIKLWPTRNEFVLMTSETTKKYKVKIVDAVLQLATVKVNPGVLVGHAEALLKRPALYPLKRSSIKTFTVGKGQYSSTVENVFDGEVPEKVLVAMTSSTAYSGSLTKNPFNFKNYLCNYLGLFVEGQSVPAKPLQPNFAADSTDSVNAYLTLFEGMTENQGLDFDRDDYTKGYTIYALNIDQTLSKESLALKRRGHTRLDIKFAGALAENITVIIYATFSRLLRIDAARNIIL